MRAELEVDGLAIDFGSSDQHKYTRGGWGTGWAAVASEADGTTFATTSGAASTVNLWVRTEPREIVMRVRTAGGKAETAKLNLQVGRAKLASGLAVTKEWQVVRANVDSGNLPTGR